MTDGVLTGVRRAGVLLHPTSLPGPWESGVLGSDAFRFVDWLADAGFSLWQTLPLGPVGESLSPYQMSSAFAGNRRLIDPVTLPIAATGAPSARYDWAARKRRLHDAWLEFRADSRADAHHAFDAYWHEEQAWLLPFALFRAARRRHGDAGWWTWPEPLRRREPSAVDALMKEEADGIRETAFEQWIFDTQWKALKDHARERGIELIGDLPIYVDLDSVDVWWHRRLFRVDESGQPEAVAGVPPDYFSADGQLWGNPLYRWEVLQAESFRWWVDRVRTQLKRFDWLRIDHFRGLEAYWEVPAGATSARDGAWREAPGAALLEVLRATCGGLPFLAEDLGTITPAVHELRQRFGLPGMLVAQFAFDGSGDNPYLPANHVEDAVLYPGTHDNDTVLGWYRQLDDGARDHVHRVLGCNAADLPGALLASVWHSRARTAIFQFQDLLQLDSRARMNTPGTVTGNWGWRFSWADVPDGLAAQCRHQALDSGRLDSRQERP